MTEICKYNECTGCYACANVCGHDAIIMRPNKYGYIHPEILTDKCIDCGACRIVCPNNSKPTYRQPIKALAACASDADEQLTSTSGGIASVLGRHILKNGGVVYGCTGKDWNNIQHIRIDKESDIELLKGSKYVQSKINFVFKEIREDLVKGNQVVFIGTPCQVAGLLSFIPVKLQDQLLTVDFVCHGVPNQKMLSEWLCRLLDRNKDTDSDLAFRIKQWRKSPISPFKIVNGRTLYKASLEKKYRTRYGLFILGNKGVKLNHPFPKDDYIVGFLTGLLYRDSCYQCHYAKAERVSDITLGDFHFDKYKDNKVKGENRLLSKVIVNTEKGHTILNTVSADINCVEINYESLLKNKSQLSQPMSCPQQREKFLNDYGIIGIDALPINVKHEKRRLKRHLLKTRIMDVVYSFPIMGSVLYRLRHD